MLLWTAAILAALGLAWFLGANVSSLYSTRTTLMLRADGKLSPEEAIMSLGGTESATRKFRLYLHLPRRIATGREEIPLLLGRCGSGVVSILANTLSDPDKEVRWNAATTLGYFGPRARSAAPKLVRALCDPDISQAAAVALVATEVDCAKAVPVLVEALNDQQINQGWFCEVAKSLARLGPQAGPAVPALAKALDSNDPVVRSSAIFALCRIGPATAGAIPILLRKLDDPDGEVRASALVVIGSIGPSAKECVSRLVAALDDPAGLVRENAAAALGEIGPSASEAIPALDKLSKSNDHSATAAAEALRKIRGEEPPK